MLFVLKNKTEFKNTGNLTEGQGNLTYSTEILGDLVNRDTDVDGILDWEEGLWGTDPTKKDTDDDGVLDDAEIAKLKAETKEGESLISSIEENEETLTETDKFSRELFATIAALSQNGTMDEATVEKLTSSLAEHIQNIAPRKVFLISEITIIQDDSAQAVQNYNDILINIRNKYPLKEDATNILAESMNANGDINVGTLSELNPIIKQMNGIIGEMLIVNTPQSLALLHLDIINGFERLSENLSDIKLVDADTILALGAVTQYVNNAEQLQVSMVKLSSAIDQKLNN